MEGVDVVFHCAALKHVTIGEYNPFEIVRTNLVGLQNVVQSAIENRVSKVVFTSSDKAVNPTNAMGASKLMGERLIAAANEMRGTSPTRFASVRFGNILGSNGSVVDIFRRQIAGGGPVTLTDGRMTRFVMGLTKAVRLVLHTAELAVGGEVFVLKMPVMRIGDLAEVMVNQLAPGYGHAPEDIKVTEVGAKRGEKMFEELLMESEVALAYENDDLMVYLGDRADFESAGERSYLRGMRPATRTYHSGEAPRLTCSQIEEFLHEVEVLRPAAREEVAR
jgi:FlaA1/EpsC-like NDP-sugar epimerase